MSEQLETECAGQVNGWLDPLYWWPWHEIVLDHWRMMESLEAAIGFAGDRRFVVVWVET